MAQYALRIMAIIASEGQKHKLETMKLNFFTRFGILDLKDNSFSMQAFCVQSKTKTA